MGFALRVAFLGGVLMTQGLSATPALAEDFYAGRQITFIVGTGAGGGNDLYARVLSQFLPAHIPGRPAVVVQNMPGSDGSIAAGHVFNIAAKDGTVVATSPSSMLLAEAANPSVRFNSRKFTWIGTIATMTDVLAVFRSTGLNSIADARQKEVVIGASGNFGLSSLEPAVANAFLGTRFRVVKGYSGGDSVNLAMERKEIEGRTNQWSSWKVLRPDWIREGRLSYLVQYGPKEPELPDVPTMRELVSAPDERAVVDLLEVAQYVGRAVYAPPGVPPLQADILHAAFTETMTDPGYVARMNELNLDLNPRTAADIDAVLARALENKEEVVHTMKARLGVN
jgi:tripartite-type tricarboxylate transporter receptor subunit TctC